MTEDYNTTYEREEMLNIKPLSEKAETKLNPNYKFYYHKDIAQAIKDLKRDSGDFLITARWVELCELIEKHFGEFKDE